MLSGMEIIKAIENKDIIIKPFNKDQVNPNSYNLTLGKYLYVYEDGILDCKKKNKLKKIIIPKDGYILRPNEIYLALSNEYTQNDVYVPQVSGRSSIGRVGLMVHSNAGGGAIGFKGKWLYNITCLLPTKVYEGMQIGQIYFFPLIGDSEIRYSGNHNNQKKVKSTTV